MQFKFGKKPENNDDNNQIKEEIIRELLRQVKCSYNLALGVTAASALITLASLGLRYMNKASEATLISSGGIVATVTSVKIAKQSKQELQEIMEKFYHK